MTRPLLLLLLLLVLALPLASCEPVSPDESDQQDHDPITCSVELRSWVVMAQGRHLYLECDCPPPFDHLNERIEYTKATLRSDFLPGLSPTDRAAAMVGRAEFPIARMTPGQRLQPMAGPGDDRLEQGYTLPVETVKQLQRDRVFTRPYRLLGPNSNSGIRAIMAQAGVPMPSHVLAGGGMLGAFPGIDRDPGEEIGEPAWPELGLPNGPIRPTPEAVQ